MRHESRGSVNNSAWPRSCQASPINNETLKCKSVPFEVAFSGLGFRIRCKYLRERRQPFINKDEESRGSRRAERGKKEREKERITGWTFVKYKNDGCDARNGGKKGNAIFQAEEQEVAPRTFQQLLESRTRTSKAYGEHRRI